MLGVRPILGRGFIEEEKRPQRDAHVAVLSYPFWKQRFAGSRQALEEVLWLNGQPFQIVGVLPEGYRSLHGFGSEPPSMFRTRAQSIPAGATGPVTASNSHCEPPPAKVASRRPPRCCPRRRNWNAST
jgi:hypothetical protein